MTLDLDYDEGASAVADAVSRFCADRCSDAVARGTEDVFPHDLWSDFCELGIFAAAGRGEDASVLELCAAMEALGHAAFPGPVVTTCVAVHALPESEQEDLVAGTSLATLGTSPLVAWARVAQVFLLAREGQIHRAEPQGEIQAVKSLSGECWGRVVLEEGARLPDSAAALGLGEIVLGSYLCGAGRRLIEDAAKHAGSRRQFGHPIGEFQAVAHPLADCWMRLDAARALVRRAAWVRANGDPEEAGYRSAVGLRSAAAASVEAVHAAHQTFGAVGITLEGPVFHISRRIRQGASTASVWPRASDVVRSAWESRAGQAATPWNEQGRKSDG